MTCKICNHKKRAEIERACLLRNYGDTEVTLRDIAREYGVDLKELQVHVLMHIPLEESARAKKDDTVSIASEIKRREADILRSMMEDTYVTFKNANDKISAIIGRHTSESPTLNQLTKPLVDLYLGASQSIRDTADSLIKMNNTVNGEKDEGLQALAALGKAIRGD